MFKAVFKDTYTQRFLKSLKGKSGRGDAMKKSQKGGQYEKIGLKELDPGYELDSKL